MEFAGSSSNDCFAGYLQDDSDLEFSDCSEEPSSDEGEVAVKRCAVSSVRSEGGRGRGGEWSEDEFERDMESELMGLLQTVASPDTLMAISSQGPGKSRRHRKIKSSSAVQTKGIPLSSGTISSRADEQGVDNETPNEGGRGGEEDEEESGQKQLEKAGAYYDKLYFETSSSGEEDGEGEREEQRGGSKSGGREKRERSERRRNECRRPTDEELFYDPHMDEEDEKWVQRQRMAYHNVKVSQKLSEEQQKRMTNPHPPPPPATAEPSTHTTTPSSERGEQSRGGKTPATSLPKRSDAHLSCPACMTTVCIDCQQHTYYSNQFRAMFVMNCRISKDEVLKHVPKLSKRERQKRRRRGQREREDERSREAEAEVESEDYHPVHCAECNTEIAVYDRDEVFHFYNVLASAAS